MKIIRDTKLFDKIKDSNYGAWDALFSDDQGTLENEGTPTFFGGLDHIDMKKRGVYYHDIGCNGKDNSFVVRPELK